MFVKWADAQKAGRSPLCLGRSAERNKRKQERTNTNRIYRAELHREKVNSRGDANVVQGKIAEISKRK